MNLILQLLWLCKFNLFGPGCMKALILRKPLVMVKEGQEKKRST